MIGDEAEIGGKGDDRPCAGCGSIDRSDDGQRALPHGLHDGAGHSGELQKAPWLGVHQLADDLVDVASRAEASPLAGDDQHGNVVAMRNFSEQVPKVGVNVESECVELVRSSEGDRPYLILHGEIEVLPLLGESRRGSEPAHGRDPTAWAVAARCIG